MARIVAEDEALDEAVDAIAKLTPDELRVFARVQHRLAGIPDDGGNCLLF